jgi:hypothetical protein
LPLVWSLPKLVGFRILTAAAYWFISGHKNFEGPVVRIVGIVHADSTLNGEGEAEIGGKHVSL